MSVDNLIDLALNIQQIPAPTLEESKRAEFVRARFAAEGLSDVQVDLVGNVLARLPGKGSNRPLILSAHLDTVFPQETDLTYHRDTDRISGPGLGDNSLGVAALFGILWRLRELSESLSGDLWFVANVCEEGLGDLRGMKALVDRFGGDVKGYLVIEGLSFGHVYHRGTGVRRFKITTRCLGGHSWSDYGQPSAIHELAGLVTRIAALKLPETPRTTLNVGRFTGGTSINTVAAQAQIELDLRSEDESVLRELIQKVEDLIASANKPGVRYEKEIIGDRPAGFLSAEHPFIAAACASLRDMGVDPVLTIGSTDANVPFSHGYPAVVLGVTTGSGAHTVNEYIDVPPLTKGIEHLVDFIRRVMR